MLVVRHRLFSHSKRTMKYTCLAFVFLAVFCHCYAQDCTTVGTIICDANCTSVLLCLGNGTGNGFVTEVVEECEPEVSSCYLPERGCSTTSSSCGDDNFDFRCTAIGSFPDPFDCQRYYVCVNRPGFEDANFVDDANFFGDGDYVEDEETPAGDTTPYQFEGFRNDCEEDLAYDALRQVCSLHLDSRPCREGPVPDCTTLGQVGAIVENQSIYYICHREEGRLFPILYLCPRGGSFNEETKQCED